MQYYSCIISTVFLFILNCDGNPLFFVNPFSTSTASDGESENVSIYTTTAKTSQSVTESPTVYQQIARNVLERIVSRLVIPINTNSRLVSNRKNSYTGLEIVDDSIEDSNSADLDKEDEVDDKELINPMLIDSNPSFKVIPMGRSHPERFVVDSTTWKPGKEIDWDETDDLNLDDGQNMGKDFTENGLLRVLELVASTITLLGGAFSALFRPMMDSN